MNGMLAPEKTMTTKELADFLGTSSKVVLENARKCLPNKMIENGYTDFAHLHHNLNFHNSLESALEYFEDIGKVETIITCHLSNIGGLEDNIKNYMNKYAKHLYIAKKGTKITF